MLRWVMPEYSFAYYLPGGPPPPKKKTFPAFDVHCLEMRTYGSVKLRTLNQCCIVNERTEFRVNPTHDDHSTNT